MNTQNPIVDRFITGINHLLNVEASRGRAFDKKGFCDDFVAQVAFLPTAHAQDALADPRFEEWVREADKLGGGYDHLGHRLRRQLERQAWTEARTYKPLMVTPQPSNKKPGKMVAFIGKQLCFFEDREAMPAAGKPVEVMITRVLYGNSEDPRFQDADGKLIVRRDFTKVVALLIRVVDRDHYVLSHAGGFQCSGSMCSTTSTGRLDGLHDRGNVAFHTPGRTDVFVADNVNMVHGIPPVPKRPTWIWVRRDETRVCQGLTRIEDGTYARYVRR